MNFCVLDGVNLIHIIFFQCVQNRIIIKKINTKNSYQTFYPQYGGIHI